MTHPGPIAWLSTTASGLIPGLSAPPPGGAMLERQLRRRVEPGEAPVEPLTLPVDPARHERAQVPPGEAAVEKEPRLVRRGLEGSGGSYDRTITDPAEDKTYSGSGTVSGGTLRLKGCVLKVLCKSQTWTRL